MKRLAPFLFGICLVSIPASTVSAAVPDNPIVLAGEGACVGPLCVGRDHDRDWGYRHHRRFDRDRDFDRRHYRDRYYDHDRL
jgi:hypothetical protein